MYYLSALSVLVLLDGYAAHLDLHSFPTRRSSDLITTVWPSSLLSRRSICSTISEFLESRFPVGSSARRIFGNRDRKSTRLNSSHLGTSYAVFCLKKKN